MKVTENKNDFVNNFEQLIESMSKVINNKDYFQDRVIPIFFENTQVFNKSLNIYFSFDKNDFIFEPIPGDTLFVQRILFNETNNKDIESFLNSKFSEINQNKDDLSMVELSIPVNLLYALIKEHFEWLIPLLSEQVLAENQDNKNMFCININKKDSLYKLFAFDTSYFDFISKEYYETIINSVFVGDCSLKLFNKNNSDLQNLFFTKMDFIFNKGYFSEKDLKKLLIYCLENDIREITKDFILDFFEDRMLIENYKQYIIILTYLLNSFLKNRNTTMSELLNSIQDVSLKEDIRIKMFRNQFSFFETVNNLFIINNNIKNSISDLRELYSSLTLSSYYNMYQLFVSKGLSDFDVNKIHIVSDPKDIDFNKIFFDSLLIYSVMSDYVSNNYYSKNTNMNNNPYFDINSYTFIKIIESLLSIISNQNNPEFNNTLLSIPYLFNDNKFFDKDGVLAKKDSYLFINTFSSMTYKNLLFSNQLIWYPNLVLDLLKNNPLKNIITINSFESLIRVFKYKELTKENVLFEFIKYLVDKVEDGTLTLDQMKCLKLTGIYPGNNLFEGLFNKKLELDCELEDFLENNIDTINKDFNISIDKNKKGSLKYESLELTVLKEMNEKILKLREVLEKANQE